MKKAQQESARRIRLAAQVIEKLVPLELQSFSQRRKHTLEGAYGTFSVHAARLHLPLPSLSTYYDPRQYLAVARDLLGQLARLEALTRAERPAVEGEEPGHGPGWRVQPEESALIHYPEFQLLYGFSPQEIDWIITIVQHYYPQAPILNRTVEWAVLKQRDYEAQDLLAQRYEASRSAPWHPREAPWWDDPAVVRQRLLIALYFGEWLHAAYPPLLPAGDEQGPRLVAQTEAVLSMSVAQLTDMLDARKKGAAPPQGEMLLALAHVVGAFVSLICCQGGAPDGLDLVWNRLSELGERVDVLVDRLATYYERLAGRKPPIRDDEALLIGIFRAEASRWRVGGGTGC